MAFAPIESELINFVEAKSQVQGLMQISGETVTISDSAVKRTVFFFGWHRFG